MAPASTLCLSSWSAAASGSRKSGPPEADFVEVQVESKAISEEVLHRLIEMTSDVRERVALVRIHLAPEENAVLGQGFHPKHGVGDVNVI